MLSAALAACALEAPASSRFATRRAVVTALPLAASWAGAARVAGGGGSECIHTLRQATGEACASIAKCSLRLLQSAEGE